MKKTIRFLALFLALICTFIYLPATTSAATNLIDVTASFASKDIVIRSCVNGMYLAADTNVDNAPLLANRSSKTNWCRFSVSNLTDDGYVGLRAHNGKCVSARLDISDAPLQSVGSALAAWECVRIYVDPDGKFYIKSQVTEKYITIRIDKSNNPAEARGPQPSTWEQLDIQILSKDRYAYVNTSNPNNRLKMRADASSSAEVIGYLCYGDQVIIHSTYNGYAKITVNGKSGYASTKYLSRQRPSSTVKTNEDGVSYQYVTVTLDTSNLQNWVSSFMKAHEQLGSPVAEITVNARDSMKVTEPLPGPPVNGQSPSITTTIQAPSRITFKVHKHERVMGFGRSARYENGCIVTSYSCNCGYFKDLVVWEIPIPDPSEFVGKQINQTIKIQAQQSYWINNKWK